MTISDGAKTDSMRIEVGKPKCHGATMRYNGATTHPPTSLVRSNTIEGFRACIIGEQKQKISLPYKWYFHWLNLSLKVAIVSSKGFLKFIAKTTNSEIGRGYTYPNYTDWPRTVSSCWLKSDYRRYQNWFDEDWSGSSRCAMVRTVRQYYGATPRYNKFVGVNVCCTRIGMPLVHVYITPLG
jgi:hypothetical protein